MNAWMDEEGMIEWFHKNFIYLLDGKTLLIMDSLKVHMSTRIVSYFAHYDVHCKFIPGGCTGIIQPLDVGIMKPLKHYMKEDYIHYYSSHAFPINALQRRKDMHSRAVKSYSYEILHEYKVF